MDKPSAKDLIAVIEKSRGNVSEVARVYGRPRSTVQSWIDNMPTVAQALEDARQTRVDVAETVIYKAMAVEENLSAAFYILNNDPRAKARGWGPRQELHHSGSLNLRELSDDDLRRIIES